MNTHEEIQKSIAEIKESLGSKAMKVFYNEDDEMIYVELMLKNITKPFCAFDIIEGYVVRFDSIKKGRLLIAIDLDLEE